MWREVGTAFMYHCVKFIQPFMCILRVYLSVYLEVCDTTKWRLLKRHVLALFCQNNLLIASFVRNDF